MAITLNKIGQLFKFYSLGEIIQMGIKEFQYLYIKNFTHKDFLLTQVYDYKMYIPLNDDGIGKVLYVRGSRELDHKYIMEEEIKVGNTILDLGANIGYYVLMEAMLMGKEGKIIAIEPDYRNIQVLKKNIKLNNIQNIEIIEGAISNKDGKEEFFLANKTNLNSFIVNKEDITSYEKVKVNVYSLKNFLNEYNEQIDLIRMDIEGHEVEVFESLVEYSKERNTRLPKKIIFETHKSKYTKEHPIKPVLEKLFYEVGYYPKYLTTANEKYSKFSKLEKQYKPIKIIKEFPFVRGIYKNIDKKDAIKLIAELGSIRTVCLELEKD